jgi:hypothetical protein
MSKLLISIMISILFVACAEDKKEEAPPTEEAPIDNACKGHEYLTDKFNDSSITFSNDCQAVITRTYIKDDVEETCVTKFSFYNLDNDLYFRPQPDFDSTPMSCFMPDESCEIIILPYSKEIRCSL